MTKKLPQFATLALIASFAVQPAIASPLEVFKKPKNLERLKIHPFNHGFGLSDNSENANLKANSISLQHAIKRVLHNKFASPFLQFREVQSGLGLSDSEHIEFDAVINDVKICNSQIKSSMIDGSYLVTLGQVPNIENFQDAPSDVWVDYNQAFQFALHWLKSQNTEIESSKIISKEKCYFVTQDDIKPVWQINAKINGLSQRFWADSDKIYHFENGFFSVQGSLKAYVKNPIDGEVATYKVELTGDKTLTSDYFKTKTYSIDRATADDHNFSYNEDDDRFAEVNSFAHASLAHEFFKELGYNWSDAKPLDLHVHKVINNTTNNALYEPSDSTGTGYPSISIGDGDGKVLQNLPYDGDVVSHEFGHHIVYQTLKTISGESLVLHEGLADYFTFAKTQDPCLGESICPAKSGACWVQSQCLRTADNTISYGDANYSKLSAHPRSQVVSGLLWDLHTKHDIPFEDATKIAYGAVKELSKSSGFYDLILALLIADKKLMNSKYGCTIFDAAEDRGFTEVMDGVDCKKSEEWGNPGDKSLTTKKPASSSSSEESSKPGGFNCGTISMLHEKNSKHFNYIFAIILLAVPLLTVQIRKP